MEDSKSSIPIIGTPEEYNRINEVEKKIQDTKEEFPTIKDELKF